MERQRSLRGREEPGCASTRHSQGNVIIPGVSAALRVVCQGTMLGHSVAQPWPEHLPKRGGTAVSGVVAWSGLVGLGLQWVRCPWGCLGRGLRLADRQILTPVGL